jgi:peptidoglycan/xylan/chitin deacetylase (PgdA/CDA1 family)
MPKLFRLVVALWITSACSLSSFARQGSVALTFDDLPVAGTLDSAEARSINITIMDSLQRHQAPAIGFVIERRVHEIGQTYGQGLLDQWVARGFELGNHTFSHATPDGLTAEQFEHEIVAGESSFAAALAKAGKAPRYFRFPKTTPATPKKSTTPSPPSSPAAATNSPSAPSTTKTSSSMTLT